MQDHSFIKSPVGLILSLSALFFIVFVVVSGVLYLGHGEKRAAPPFFGTGTVGLVELNGVILDSKKVIERLERLEEQPDIKAVVLRLNSPGGAVAPSQEIYEKVKSFSKPLVVSMGSTAASGAFYIAMGSKTVFANPGTLTGSIGVIMEFANLSKLYEWAKIQRYSIRAGKYKGAGAEYRELSPEERELIQGTVDDVMDQFQRAVAESRGLTLAQVREVADGRVMTGRQALKAHLIDRLGTLDDAILEAGLLAKIKGKPRVTRMGRKRGLLNTLMEDSNWGGENDAEGRSRSVLDTLSRLFGFLPGQGGSLQPTLEPGLYWLWGGARTSG